MKRKNISFLKTQGFLVVVALFAQVEVGKSQTSILTAPSISLAGNALPDRVGPQTNNLSILRHLSSPISLILHSSIGIGERIHAVRMLGDDLNESEIGVLYAFLISPPQPEEKNLPGVCVLKNDLLAALEWQSVAPPNLTDVMVQIYRNQKQGAVMRDYALQHLALWHEHLTSDDLSSVRIIRQTLEEAAQENASLAGTALLGLHRVFPETTSAEGIKVNADALRMATSPNLDQNARITAIQVCAERKIVEVLQVAANLAATADSTAVRISAIGAIGKLGSPKQAALLQGLASERNPTLRTAIKAALKKLESTVAERNSF